MSTFPQETKVKTMELNKIYNLDCLEGMRLLGDNSVDLVLTDPPYGILPKVSTIGGEGLAKNIVYPEIDWDNKLSPEIIREMFRVSDKHIIFGFEHLSHLLPPPKGVLCWDKKRPEGTTFSEFELIWTDLGCPQRFIRFMWHGMLRDSKEVIKQPRWHPTQKPLEVVKELILRFTEPGDIVLDPFMGSGTTAQACKELGRRFIGFEISLEYCKIAEDRLKQEVLNFG